MAMVVGIPGYIGGYSGVYWWVFRGILVGKNNDTEVHSSGGSDVIVEEVVTS